MPTEEPLISNFQDLVNLLVRDGVMHKADLATKSVQIPTERKGQKGWQIIRWQDQDGAIQFIQSIGVEVSADRFASVEAAIARLNHGMAWPGLDLNHEFFALTYRMVLPLVPRGGVLPTEIQTCFRMATKTGTDITPTLRRIVAGTLDPLSAIADAQKEFATPAGAAPPAEEKPAPPPFPVD